MKRRGVTLIELLAAIAIMAVVMAIAFPALENRLSGARFEAAQGQFEAAILMARTEAQRRGTPVSLVVRGLSGGESGLFLEAPPGAPGGEEPPARRSGVPAVVLGSGIRITAERPGAVPQQPAHPGPASPTPSSTAGSEPPLVIARFLPDGSASAPGPVYLAGRDQAAAVVVNRWTGSAVFRAISLQAPESEPVPEAPPEAPAGSEPR